MIGWLIKMGLGLGPGPPNQTKYFPEILLMTIFIRWPVSLPNDMQFKKIYSNITFKSRGRTHYYVTTSEVDGMVEENIGAVFNKVAVISKRLQHRCFPVNIGKFLRTPILKNICELFRKK